ncbi:MAG: hypothetical protein JJU02_15340 [Cryomorphaceae bacterium]|nr:hypothetical protein [Cryomorphaceae bacterium]
MKKRTMVFRLLMLVISISLFTFCSKKKNSEKGFPSAMQRTSQEVVDGIDLDSITFPTRPGGVLLTSWVNHRIIPEYKLNHNQRTKRYFTGSNAFHKNYVNHAENSGNQWNNNYMPGISAVYGYNMVNVSLFEVEELKRRKLFPHPTLIKTIYFPAFSQDTLYHQPVKRQYILISTYDEDTNGDGFINTDDLRRFYYFDMQGNNLGTLVPKTHSVTRSSYDSKNDFMYVYATKDVNKNGTIDPEEPEQIYWIDLKNPANTGLAF